MESEHKELFERGVQLLKDDKWDEAIAVFTQIIGLYSIAEKEKALSYFHRGNAYRKQGDYALAIVDYDKAIQLRPNFSEAYNNRGAVYGEQGDHARTIADYDKAIELQEDNAEAYNNRGIAYSKQGDYVRAIADYDKAIELQEDNTEAYNNRGIAYREQGDYVRAIADYDKAIELQEDNAEAYNNRGIAYRRQGDYARAIMDHDKAIQLRPNFSGAYNNRGIVYKEQGDYVRAIADYDKAIGLDPNNKSPIHNKGVAMALQQSENEKEEFRQDLQKQLEAHQSDILDVGQYREKAQGYNAEKSKMEDTRGFFIMVLFFLAVIFYGVAVALWFLFNKGDELNHFHLFPFVLMATLVLSPVVWFIRILNRNINKVWALRENAYTNSILTLLINAGSDKDSEDKKKLIAKYFDHHDKRGSAQLIMDGERGEKRDNDAINMLQNVFHKKEE